MKIALFGYGKMGKMIEEIASAQHHTVVAKFSKTLSLGYLEDVDVCIDFSQASCLLENVQKCAAAKKPLVIGTTGWDKEEEAVKAIVKQSGIGAIYSTNFSEGVFFFLRLIAEAAKWDFPFEVAGMELHHKTKLDAPSGTAKAMSAVYGREIPFASVRLGSLSGTHSLIFDSPTDTITLKHEAKNRKGFAIGALKAAKWILNKTGWYTLEEMYGTMDIINHSLSR